METDHEIMERLIAEIAKVKKPFRESRPDLYFGMFPDELYDEGRRLQQEYFGCRKDSVQKLQRLCRKRMWERAAASGRIYVPAAMSPIMFFGLLEGAIDLGSSNDGSEPCYATLDEANRGFNDDMSEHKVYVVIDAKKGSIDDVVGRTGKSALAEFLPRGYAESPHTHYIDAEELQEFPELGDVSLRANRPEVVSTIMAVMLGWYVRLGADGFYVEGRKPNHPFFQATAYETLQKLCENKIADVQRAASMAEYTPTVPMVIDRQLVDYVRTPPYFAAFLSSPAFQELLGEDAKRAEEAIAARAKQ